MCVIWINIVIDWINVLQTILQRTTASQFEWRQCFPVVHYHTVHNELASFVPIVKEAV